MKAAIVLTALLIALALAAMGVAADWLADQCPDEDFSHCR